MMLSRTAMKMGCRMHEMEKGTLHESPKLSLIRMNWDFQCVYCFSLTGRNW